MIPLRIREGRVFPDYFGPEDLPWLRALLEQQAACVGLPRRCLRERWREPLFPSGPEPKRRLMTEVLDRLQSDRERTRLSSRLLRQTLFGERVTSVAGDDEVWQSAAAKLGITREVLEDALFADLPGERIVSSTPDLTVAELVPRGNLELVQRLIRRSIGCRVQLRGETRAVVRAARWRGLLCVVEGPGRPFDSGGPSASDEVVLGLSGPLSVIHHTTLYGRALASLIPLFAWCSHFHLRARCFYQGQALLLEVRSGDALLPGREPKAFDSKLEQRFARDMERTAPEWEVIREPEPVAVGRRWIFPDFALRHRQDPSRRWLLEIAGFWTPRYLEHKLRDLRLAGLDNLILCLDADRACGDDAVPAGARLVRYRRKIDVRTIVEIMESGVGGRCGTAARRPTSQSGLAARRPSAIMDVPAEQGCAPARKTDRIGL